MKTITEITSTNSLGAFISWYKARRLCSAHEIWHCHLSGVTHMPQGNLSTNRITWDRQVTTSEEVIFRLKSYLTYISHLFDLCNVYYVNFTNSDPVSCCTIRCMHNIFS
jgi:hypothetical protein